jgi:hypothetical protein
MKTSPETDPLLEAVLAHSDADRSLRLLLQGARRRRIRRRLQRAAVVAALPLFGLAAAWLIGFDPGGQPAPAPSDPACIVVATPDRSGPARAFTRPESVRALETVTGTVQIVASDGAMLEVIRGEEALLELLSVPAGFIGKGAERHLVFFEKPGLTGEDVR